MDNPIKKYFLPNENNKNSLAVKNINFNYLRNCPYVTFFIPTNRKYITILYYLVSA